MTGTSSKRAFERCSAILKPYRRSEIDMTNRLRSRMLGLPLCRGQSYINALTVPDKGSTEIRDKIKLSKTRPHLVNDQAFLVPKRSVFNKVVGDSGFELDIAAFLDGCRDIISFVKNSQSTQFRMEYRRADGGIANYYPDFLVKRTDSEIWVIETKGREDLDDPPKWERLQQWCADATAHDGKQVFKPLSCGRRTSRNTSRRTSRGWWLLRHDPVGEWAKAGSN